MELERIRQKVWSGERLSDEELRALEHAARREGGPVWRTTVAQALINADAASQALPLLEAVRRDFPRDVQAHLALGRALVLLERWGEAEAPLQRALELNPVDPEPKKALAVVALRRAEWARARRWLDEVLQVDPLDDEAQLLWGELERLAPGEVAAAPSTAAFTRALVAALRGRSIPHLVTQGQLVIRQGQGAVARFELDALFRETQGAGRSLEEAAALVARDLGERSLGLPPGRLRLLARVLPVLRDSAFLERSEGAVRREGPGTLWFFYAVEDPEVVLYVPEGRLAAHRLTLEQLDEAAWRNLEARPTAPRPVELELGGLRLSEAPTGLWALAAGDGHDAARLFTPSHQAALAQALGPGPWRVYLGLRELVLLCREDDAAAVAKLGGLDAAREGIAGAWRFAQGRLAPVPGDGEAG